MVCNTQAGVGSPVSVSETDPESDDRLCEYDFKWESLYACPVCRDSDLKPIRSPCVDGVVHIDYGSDDCWNRDQVEKNKILSCDPSATSITINEEKVKLDE